MPSISTVFPDFNVVTCPACAPKEASNTAPAISPEWICRQNFMMSASSMTLPVILGHNHYQKIIGVFRKFKAANAAGIKACSPRRARA
jgi:hypothetical protein